MGDIIQGHQYLLFLTFDHHRSFISKEKKVGLKKVRDPLFEDDTVKRCCCGDDAGIECPHLCVMGVGRTPEHNKRNFERKVQVKLVN